MSWVIFCIRVCLIGLSAVCFACASHSWDERCNARRCIYSDGQQVPVLEPCDPARDLKICVDDLLVH